MSQITENTLVVRIRDKEGTLALLDEHVVNFVELPTGPHDDVAVFVYDYNGDSLFLDGSDIVPVIKETSYMDGESVSTIHNGVDTSNSAAEILKEYISDSEVYKTIVQSISYTH